MFAVFATYVYIYPSNNFLIMSSITATCLLCLPYIYIYIYISVKQLFNNVTNNCYMFAVFASNILVYMPISKYHGLTVAITGTRRTASP